jgi:hypothetical protein
MNMNNPQSMNMSINNSDNNMNFQGRPFWLIK